MVTMEKINSSRRTHLKKSPIEITSFSMKWLWNEMILLTKIFLSAFQMNCYFVVKNIFPKFQSVKLYFLCNKRSKVGPLCWWDKYLKKMQSFASLQNIIIIWLALFHCLYKELRIVSWKNVSFFRINSDWFQDFLIYANHWLWKFYWLELLSIQIKTYIMIGIFVNWGIKMTNCYLLLKNRLSYLKLCVDIFLKSTAKISELYSQPSRTSKKELFANIVNSWSVHRRWSY